MNSILLVAILATFFTSLVVVFRFGHVKCEGPMPVSLFTFGAILFTSGLDVGMIMLPLTEFPVYAREAEYGFTNPLAVAFGFWGFLVWLFYFLTTFYFCVVEPRVRLFEIPAVKLVNNLVVIGTCAFTGYLFLFHLPSYVAGIADPWRYGLVGLVVLLAVCSSTEIAYVKRLSVSSVWLFFALIAGMWTVSGMGLAGSVSTATELGGYFSNLHRFIAPINDYHAFYLFWWFSWSIMIGQFVSRFVGGLSTWKLLIALLVIPSVPIGIWFSVLYYYFAHDIGVGHFFNLGMVVVGILFVINSLDSLVRLYTVNLGFTVERLGRAKYIAANWAALSGLILLYQFTPLKIEWIGLVVIALYGAVYVMLFNRRGVFQNSPV